MTRRVMTILASEPLSLCVKIMSENNIGSVVVLENDNPAGIFTERDLVKTMAGGKENLQTKMSHVMSKSLTTISSTATLWDAVSLMGRLNIRRLPVLEKGKLVGILTEKDVFRVIVSQQNLLLEYAAEYLPALTREQLRTLVTQFGVERPPTLQ